MVVAVTGSSGQFGQALQSIAHLYPHLSFHFLDRISADITNLPKLRELFSHIKPDFCINSAAYTAVDKAESEPGLAYEINVAGARNVAQACRDNDVTLIHLSTDFVFDGKKNVPYTESDPTNPLGVYGKTKLEGELAVRSIIDNHIIIRTSWLYSQFGHNFLKTMLRLSQDREFLTVVDDQTGTPTNAVDLAQAIVTIIESGIQTYGVFHFSSRGQTTWHGFAEKIFEVHGKSIELRAISTKAFNAPAPRPQYSVLDTEKARSVFNLQIPFWEESIIK